MNKYLLIEQLLDILRAELVSTLDAVNQARDHAVHEQSKPENQYDTLALEASYLAHGQSVRAAELQRQMTVLKHLKFTEYVPDTTVVVGTIVQIKDVAAHIQWLWLLPVCGGIVLHYEDIGITTITPDAPLGHKILGCYAGDEFSLRLGQNVKSFEIMAVS